MRTAADAGTRRGAQGLASEADTRRVRAIPIWVALHTMIGGGEQVKIERDSKRNSYRWRGGKKEREKNAT